MQPNFSTGRFLSPKQLEAIDQTARRVLKQVGIHISDQKMLDILETAGAHVDRSKFRVYFDKKWLERYLALAPRHFTLHSRNGNNDIHLGSGNVYFSNGGRVFRILDMATGGYRLTMLRDVAHTAALVDQLEHINLYIISCQAHDLDPQHYESNRLRSFTHYASRKFRQMEYDAYAMTLLNSEDPLGYALRATALDNLNDCKGALGQYDRALERTPTEDPEYTILSAQRCKVLLRLGEYKRAIEDAKEALAFSSDGIDLKFQIFCALIGLGRYEEARDLFGEIATDPALTGSSQ